MPATKPRILTLGFKKPKPSSLMRHYEALYLYGTLCQLARFSELQYKDLATVENSMQIDDRLPFEALLPHLQKICRSSRSEYILLGKIKPSPNSEALILVHYLLYSYTKNQYQMQGYTSFELGGFTPGEEESCDLSIETLNTAINQTTFDCIKAILHDSPEVQNQYLPSLSNSVTAMKFILAAHLASSTQEKITLYESALAEDPKLETAYYHLARIHKKNYQLEKSILYLRKLISISKACTKNKAIYATEAGIACALLGRPDIALQWWKRAIEYAPNYLNPYFNIANVYEDQEDYASAEAYFLKAQALAPDDFRSSFNLARIYSKMGTWDKALSQYKAQLSTQMEDPWCHSDVATCYLNLGELQEAKKHLQKTVEIDPEGEAGQYAQIILSGLGQFAFSKP